MLYVFLPVMKGKRDVAAARHYGYVLVVRALGLEACQGDDLGIQQHLVHTHKTHGE